MKTMLLILMALFASCAVLSAQDARQGDAGSASASEQQGQQPGRKAAQKAASMPELEDAIPAASQPATPSARPPLLKDAGPAGVEDAARKAAHHLASTGHDGPEAKPGDQARSGNAPSKHDSASTPSEVGEFHTLPASSDRPAKPTVQKDESPAKRIHGDIYGAGSGLGHASSESVGATSKSGKTSVYVGGDQAASTAAPPP